MAKATSLGCWAWLKVKSNFTVLAWLVSVLMILAGGLWQLYLHLEERAQKARASATSAEPKPDSAAVQAKGAARDSQTAGKEEKTSGAPIQQKAEASKGGTAINVGRDVNINK